MLSNKRERGIKIEIQVMHRVLCFISLNEWLGSLDAAARGARGVTEVDLRVM
jgi:hypothetical protein